MLFLCLHRLSYLVSAFICSSHIYALSGECRCSMMRRLCVVRCYVKRLSSQLKGMTNATNKILQKYYKDVSVRNIKKKYECKAVQLNVYSSRGNSSFLRRSFLNLTVKRFRKLVKKNK